MKRFMTIVVLGLLINSALMAVLGVGDIVFDPTSYVEVVLVYEQLITTYEKIRAEYEHMLRMAQIVPVNMSARYRAALTPWTTSQPPSDLFGRNSGWVSAINSAGDVLGAYQRATEALNQYGTIGLENYPAEAINQLQTNYATIELQDGANLHTMQTIGALRANSGQVQAAIQGLEDDSLSLDPAMNTEIGVLNKINAANIVSLRNSQDTNKLLVALLEQQLTTAKRERDAAAGAVNAHIAFLNNAAAFKQRQTASITNTLTSFRMP